MMPDVRRVMVNACWVIVAMATTSGVADVYADHVDNHIWIETADGKFTPSTQAVTDAYETTHRGIDSACYLGNTDNIGRQQRNEYVTRLNNELGDGWDKVTETINNMRMVKPFTGCGEPATERSMANRLDIDFTYYHECLCGYWYANQVEDEYTYTITDLPDHRYVTDSYKREVLRAIQAGLDMWGDINDIEFTYTNSLLRADIVVQQEIPLPQRGDSYTLANGDLGCLVGNEQCTIQLFTDLNLRGEQTLMEPDQITDTIAHELGHNFGMPHNIDHDGVLSSLQDDRIRTYYEVYGINVPRIVEQHTHDTEPQTTPAISGGTTVYIQENSSRPGCEITDKCIIPSTVTIGVGGEVTWVNHDVAPHTITSGILTDGGPDGVFNSGLFRPGAAFSHRFEVAGEYPYFDLVHPWIAGLVIVQDTSATNSGQSVEVPRDDDIPGQNTPGHGSLEQRLIHGELAGTNLRDVDLSGLDLRGADLSGVDLRGVNLSGFDLARADLSKANLYRANLYGANLTNADLSLANLSGAYLAEADLRRAYLAGADLAGADLSGANLSMSYLRGTDLTRANLAGSILLGAYLADATLAMADLRNADMGDVDLRRANLSGADLTGAFLNFAYMNEVDLTNADLTGASMFLAYLIGANLDGVNLDGVDLELVFGP